jgi:hypothetical protein
MGITTEVIAEEQPDAVIVAVGAAPFIPEMPGISTPKRKIHHGVSCFTFEI